MTMEEKLVINELQHGKELAYQLMSNLKHTSSIESNKILISEILRIYQNSIFMLSFNDDNDDKNILKRSHEIDDKDCKNVSKKRKASEEKKIEEVRVYVGTGNEKDLMDDGYCWRKYGQKKINESVNPRGYYRCTHRFTQKCLAVKQVQKSDKDPSIFEVKYLGNHTCQNTNRVAITEKSEDIKPKKTEEVLISLEDFENKKKNVFRTFSFSNIEIASDWWKSNIFSENRVGKPSPAPSGSEITSEIVPPPASVENSETVDSYFLSLDNIIDLGQDWL